MSQCPSCGGDCGYGPLRHCQQGINHETDFRNSACTSDEWLANTTQSTRDLANKIKVQQLRGTGNQFRNEDEAEIRTKEIDELKSEINRLGGALKKANSQTEEFERRWYLVQDKVAELYTQGQGISNEINDFQITIERQSVENQKIKGQQAVLIDLLRECLSVLNTIDGDDCHEVECLDDLELKCEKAIEGAML